MKNLLLGMLITIIVIFTIAASVPSNLITMKPAKPTYTVTYCGPNPHDFTVKYTLKGLQVTHTASQGYYNTYVVMSKFD